jgi:hypothetical protein
MGKYSYRNRPTLEGAKSSPLKKIEFYIPEILYNKIKMVSAEKEIPIARLASIALYNETETENPFNFDTEMPDTPYDPDAFTREAPKLMDLINSFKNGVGLDFLIMAKESAGIFTKEQLMLAFRELLEKDVIEKVHPSEIGVKGHYHKDYFHVRKKSEKITMKDAKPNRKKKLGSPLDQIK